MDKHLIITILGDCLEHSVKKLCVEETDSKSLSLTGECGDKGSLVFLQDFHCRKDLEDICFTINTELDKVYRIGIGAEARGLEAEHFTWERDFHYPHRLHAHLRVGVVDFHAEAIEVTSEDSACAVDSGLQDRISGVELFDGKAPKGYNTLEINGRPHFVVMFPHQN